jgi:hypothetical protein
MRFVPRFLRRRSLKRPTRQPLPRRRNSVLRIEALEDRVQLSTLFVVPLAQTTDGSHFHSLTEAEFVAASGDTIQIEPGTTADSGLVTISKSGTIQGDLNVPGSILPVYDLSVQTSNLLLRNLNLNNVTITAGLNSVTMVHLLVNTINETAAATGNGSNTITQSIIKGSIDLEGNSQVGTATNDVVSNNSFESTAAVILHAANSGGTVIQGNQFVGDTNNQTAVQIDDSLAAVIANNTIRLTGNPATGIQVENTTASTSITIRNNTLDLNRTGTGVFLQVTHGSQLSADIQGNDFHNDLVGLLDVGDGTAAATALGTVDAGGGSLNSLGGNNFRGFQGQGNFAIELQNQTVATTATVPAASNIFTGGTNLSVIVEDQANGGAGTVTPSALAPIPAFVQTLYNNLLGRTGTTGELNAWVNVFNASGQSVVANGILRSTESLGRTVDGLYLEYLGRLADPAGRAFWINQLQNGATLEQVTSQIIKSPEYLGHIHTDFVQSLYVHILQRTGGPQELAFWYARLGTLGLNGVALQFLTSTEYRIDAVTALYSRFLHRRPASGEAANWANTSLDLLTIEGNILGSVEFFANG